jgi:hypothetical protein
MICTDNGMEHDRVACLRRLRSHVRRRLESSGCLPGGEEHPECDEQLVCLTCYGIAKLATDPYGLLLITTEVARSDEQLSRLQGVPLTQGSRAERMRRWETCLAGTAEGFAAEITVV